MVAQIFTVNHSRVMEVFKEPALLFFGEIKNIDIRY